MTTTIHLSSDRLSYHGMRHTISADTRADAQAWAEANRPSGWHLQRIQNKPNRATLWFVVYNRDVVR